MLLILKIIGIALLVILGLVILIVALLCLVPLRYQLKARVSEGVKAKADISWLLRLVHVWLGAINAQILCKIKTLGFCLKKLHLGQWGEEKPAPAEETAPAEAEKKEAPAPQKKEETPPEKEKKKEAKKKNSDSAKPKKDKYDRLFEALEKEEKRKAQALEETEPLPEEKQAMMAKLKKIIRQVQDFWEDEKNRDAVDLIRRQLLKLGKHLLPTHFLLEGEIGLADPAATGELIGKFYRFYPLYGDHIRLQGVFDRQTVNLYTEVKGRIRLGVLVEVIVRLLLNKRCRSWVRQMMKKDKKEDKKKDKKTSRKEQAAAEGNPAVSG